MPGRIFNSCAAFLKDVVGMDLPLPPFKNIALEGRVVLDGVRKALINRQTSMQNSQGNHLRLLSFD
jgi:hypothetical protein